MSNLTTRRDFLMGCAALPIVASINPSSIDSSESDLIAFSKTCKIVNPNDGLVNFNPKPYQIEYLKALENNQFVNLIKCRQCGATTMNLIYANWLTQTQPNRKILVVGCDFNNSNCMLDRFSIMCQHQEGGFAKGSFVAFSHPSEFKNWFNENCEFKFNTVIFDEWAFYNIDFWEHLEWVIRRGLRFENQGHRIVMTATPTTDWISSWLPKTFHNVKIHATDVFSNEQLTKVKEAIGEERFKLEFI